MKVSTLAAFLAALAIPFANASGQRDDQFAWGVGGGATFTSDAAHDNHTTGAHGTISVGLGAVDSPVGLRLDGMYSSLGDRTGTATPTDQGSARVFMLSGNAIFSIYGSNTRLYGVGGIGGYWYNPDGEGARRTKDLGLQAGLGIWLPFVNAFVEAKWLNLYRALPDPVTGLRGKKSARLYPVTLGIMF
jgi:hypothetical protein